MKPDCDQQTAADSTPRRDPATTDATALSMLPPIATDGVTPTPPVIDPKRAPPPCDIDAETPDTAIDVRGTPARATARSAPHDARVAAASGRQTSADATAPERSGTANAVPWRAALEQATAEATPAAAGRAPSFEHQPVELPPSLAAATPSMREPNSHAATIERTLPQASIGTAIDEPGFGAALGNQIALWVRDGVQEARLQLHPAELGPVTVQIALDGQAAHVDFTAAVAATRESIEQSLPALAAALRESGFTLAGGGVSGHAAGHGGDGRRERSGAGSGDRSRGDALADPRAGVVTPRRWSRSLLDVYA